MRPIRKTLRNWGPLGTLAANVLAVLTGNWGVAVSVTLGILAGAWTTALEFAQRPSVQVGFAVFLASLWTLIGFAALRDRKRPRVTRPAQDYEYGLTFEGVPVHYDKNVPHAALSWGILLRNFLPHPIQYEVERFDVRFGKRSLPPVEKGKLRGYLPRGAGRMSRNVPFDAEDIKDFMGREVKGTIDLAIVYGHPERPPVRRLRMCFDITLDFKTIEGKLGYSESIVSEKDEPYEG
jgi:hypothetical protein